MQLPDGFVSDGCTGFPEAWRGIDLLPCCTAHDLAWFLHPGDWLVWAQSNVDLAVCFYQRGAWEVSFGGFLAVCTVGAAIFLRKALNNKDHQ